jgi:hypothetical protein
MEMNEAQLKYLFDLGKGREEIKLVSEISVGELL